MKFLEDIIEMLRVMLELVIITSIICFDITIGMGNFVFIHLAIMAVLQLVVYYNNLVNSYEFEENEV